MSLLASAVFHTSSVFPETPPFHFENAPVQQYCPTALTASLLFILWSTSSPPQVTESANISGELRGNAVCGLEEIYIVQGNGESLDMGLC